MSTSMSTEENKRIVRTYTGEVMKAHRPERASEFVTPDIKRHGGTLGTDKGARNLVGLLQVSSERPRTCMRPSTRASP